MKKDKESTTRKCIISGKVMDKAELIRFVVNPKKRLVPDISENLPGRGYWIQASQKTIISAQKKNSIFHL